MRKIKVLLPSKILQDLILLTWVMGLVSSGTKTITWTNVDKNLKQITASLHHNGLRQLFVWSHKYLQMFTGLASETRRWTTCMTDHGCGPKRHYRQVSNIRCAYRRCSNYIFILDLTPGFNRLCEDNCKMRRETFKFWDLVHLILEILRYSSTWVIELCLCCSHPAQILATKLIILHTLSCCTVNPLGVLTWIFLKNKVHTMIADGLTPCITRSSAAMALTKYVR